MTHPTLARLTLARIERYNIHIVLLLTVQKVRYTIRYIFGYI